MTIRRRCCVQVMQVPFTVSVLRKVQSIYILMSVKVARQGVS